MISTDYRDKVALVRLKREVTNALNLELLNQLADILHRVKDDPNTHGLVLSSSNEKFFSIGFDIPNLFELSREDFRLFYTTYNRVCLDLYTLPKPTVAAITGHAIAGGCILTLCCDYRFIAEGRKLMGVNEIKLGVHVPYPGDYILRQIVGARIARDATESGEFYPSEQLLEMGIVDQVLPLEQVLPASIEKAQALGSFPQEAFAMIKRNRVETVEAQIRAQLEEKEQFFIECWYSDETRQLLREAMEKF
jgi:enoyl-CoA hydratase/carnithine racemase